MTHCRTSTCFEIRTCTSHQLLSSSIYLGIDEHEQSPESELACSSHRSSPSPPHQTIMSSKQGWPLTWPPLSPSFVSLCSSLDLDLSGWFRWEVEAPEAAKGWQEGVRWGAHAFLIRSITLSLVCWILKTLGMSGFIGFSWWLAWLKALSVSNLYDSRILDGFDASV